MKKIALLFVGGLIVSAAFQQGYAEASKRVAPVFQPETQTAYRAGTASKGPAMR